MMSGFLLTPLDSATLVYKALRRVEEMQLRKEDVPQEVRDAVDTMVSFTVLHLRKRVVMADDRLRPAFDTLSRFANR